VATSLSAYGIAWKNISTSTTLPIDKNPWVIVVHEIEFMCGISSNSLTAVTKVTKSPQMAEALIMVFH
jgi:hypothetical protein